MHALCRIFQLKDFKLHHITQGFSRTLLITIRCWTNFHDPTFLKREVKTKQCTFIIEWFHRLQGSTSVRVCFYFKDQELGNETERGVSWMKSPQCNNDSVKQLFSTMKQGILNFKHWWLSSHLLSVLYHLFISHYSSTYIFDIFFPLVPPRHCNKKPVVPWLKAISAFPF